MRSFLGQENKFRSESGKDRWLGDHDEHVFHLIWADRLVHPGTNSMKIKPPSRQYKLTIMPTIISPSSIPNTGISRCTEVSKSYHQQGRSPSYRHPFQLHPLKTGQHVHQTNIRDGRIVHQGVTRGLTAEPIFLQSS